MTHLIIAAACCNIESCSKEPKKSYQINVEGTLELVRQSIERGLFPILFSSDYVFDGMDREYDESSKTAPLNPYGKQKEELEQRLPDYSKGNHLILRLSKIFSLEKGSGTLLDEMASELCKGRAVRAATDQLFCPLEIGDLMTFITLLLKQKARGLYNVGGSERVSRYDLALRVAKALGVSEAAVMPISLDELGGTVRPKSTALSSQKLYNDTGFKPHELCHSIQSIAKLYREDERLIRSIPARVSPSSRSWI